MKNAIVTGATGMIGSHVVKVLLQQGVNVTAIIRPMSEKIKNLERAEQKAGEEVLLGKTEVTEPGKLSIVECSLDELSTLRDKLGWEHDTFFHSGWAYTFGTGRNEAAKQADNIKATLDAVHLAYEAGCKTFVGAGSQAEFGIVSGKLSDELPKDPIIGYGIAKLAAGKLAGLECKHLGMKFNWCRILSCYGPGDNEYTMVMSAVKTMLKGERMKFTPAEQVWDYMYAEDCAKALVAVAEKGVNQKYYTVGSGEQRLLREYIYAIRDAIDPTLDVGIGEMEYYPDQVIHLAADITELVADTGYKPETTFEEGIRKTIEAVKESEGSTEL